MGISGGGADAGVPEMTFRDARTLDAYGHRRSSFADRRSPFAVRRSKHGACLEELCVFETALTV